ncbi:helix-turn-helix domain-containing protein [Rubellicoccus peritrichatus]|uniref:AraC family transcriptional regulator n=1 Tax=Rubellicoccus peritrichatus TaxID=3080537 RepID=A0AAQ3L932_9BACT|nr:helix-turn-helix domain-containing protein [Puniceicoccus sp. CR14]WOO40902.1 AraC family transcriptional regulator [Puniceicoccus sp. CR14]
MKDGMDALLAASEALSEPESFQIGVDEAECIQARNLIVFLRRTQEDLQQQHFNNRSHHRNVLLFVLKTGGSINLDGASIPLVPGEALLVQPYQFHHYVELASRDLRWLFFTFDLQEGASRLSELSHRRLRPSKDCLSVFGEIVQLWQSPELGERKAHLLALLNLGLTLLAETTKASSVKSISGKSISSADQWLARVRASLQESAIDGRSVAEVASEAGVSERHLRNRFQQATGVTIRAYKANYQLHRTISLMRDTDLTLGQISELSGFQSVQAFSRFMRRETGQSARDYRRKLLE